MRVLKQKEIEEHFDKCDFDDECDFCTEPQFGTYVKLYHEPEGVTEAEYYICGKCASSKIQEIEKAEIEYLKELDNEIIKLAYKNE